MNLQGYPISISIIYKLELKIINIKLLNILPFYELILFFI